MSDSVDWETLWKQKMMLADIKWADDHFHYERTMLSPIGFKTSDYAVQLVRRMNLLNDQTVLDIGCGDGAIAIHIAGQVKKVTALDANPNLLFPVTRRAVSEGVTNLRFVNADWLKVEIGKDVEVHDIVLASRFRQITDLRRFLEQMNSAAERRCLITWIAERGDLDEQICRIIGKEYHSLPDYSIIGNLLEDMRKKPKIELFETVETHRFESREDALESALRGYRVDNAELKKRLEKLVASGIEYTDGHFWRQISARWALIWWIKE